jgi:hypothetical protein
MHLVIVRLAVNGQTLIVTWEEGGGECKREDLHAALTTTNDSVNMRLVIVGPVVYRLLMVRL